MSNFIQIPKGTKDCLPQEIYVWQYVESFLRDKARKFGIKEIRTPIFEYTELFLRGIGEATDIVQKEMYTFNDKGNRSITLKAEGTAPTIRAFIEHSLYAQTQPTKVFYITPVFRYENVQKGRLRQHHQFGVEIFGSPSPVCDAELINMAYLIYEDLGIKDNYVNINSLGCRECRPTYTKELEKFLHKNVDCLCGICKDRLEKNPLRILDCKNEKCQKVLVDAPKILDFICDDCSNHFEEVKSFLTVFNIKFNVNSSIVRGLDYYTRTVFEILDKNGLALCGGGRYDNLIEQIGGKDVPAVGFGMGIERLMIALENEGIKVSEEETLDVFIVMFDKSFRRDALKLCNELRKLNISCDLDYLDRNLKSQMKYANKINVKNVIVIGEDEISNNYLNIKNMSTGETTKTEFDAKSIKEALEIKR